MRVLYHHRTQGRSVEAVHILGMCRGLAEHGIESEIVSPPGVEVGATGRGVPGGKSRWGTLAKRLPQICFEALEIGYNLAAVPRLLRECRRRQPDFLYERYALYNLTGVLVSRLTRTPLILEINEVVDVERERHGKQLVLRGLARWFERRIFQGAAGIAAVSGYLRDRAVEQGARPERVTVTPNAVEPEFDPAQHTGERVRCRYEWSQHTVIGFAGSFARWHRIDLLLTAVAELAPRHPEVRVLLVGDGLQREAMERLAEELGIRDRCVFTGRVPHAEMPEYLAAMDIGVMPASNVFGSPMKVFEYMAMGRPTVAPRLGPLEEALTHGEHGLLFTPDRVEALTECLRTLISDPDLRTRMGKAARSKVLREHGWAHNAQRVLALLPSRETETAAPSTAGQPALPRVQ